MCQRLVELREAMGAYAAGFDAALITASDAGAVVEQASAIENMAATVKALAAARQAQTSLWRAGGDGSAAQALARKTGTSVGAAVDAINTARRLVSQPQTLAAARAGQLSPSQASVISEAAAADPGAETKLLERAQGSSLSELRSECARTKAAADSDAEARHRRIHRHRYLRRYTDAEGAGHIHVRNTVETVAAVMSVLGPIADRLAAEAKARGESEPAEAHGADALGELVRLAVQGEAAPGPVAASAPAPVATAWRAARIPVPIQMLVRTDLDPLLRGYAISGEMTELAGYGPIPVAAVLDMIATANPFLVAIATKGLDVVNVAHLGRRFTAHQHSALDWLYPTCAAQGCGKPAQETDHRADWATTKISLLTLADRYCSRHHYLKTHRGWALVAGHGVRPFVPPDDPRHPAHGPPLLA